MSTSCPLTAEASLKEPPSDLIFQLDAAGMTTSYKHTKLLAVLGELLFDIEGRFKHKILTEGWYFESAHFLQKTLGRKYRPIMEVLFEVRRDVMTRGVAFGYKPRYDLKAVYEVIKSQAQLYKPKKPRTESQTTASQTVTYTISASDIPQNPCSQLNGRDSHLFLMMQIQGGSFYKERTPGGRVYEGGGGLQCMSSRGTGQILRGTGLIDIDMVSAHPSIAQCIIGPNYSSFLDIWCHDRSILCPNGVVTPEIKQDVLAVLNGRINPRTSVGMLLKRDMPNIIARMRELGLVTGAWRRGSMFRILEVHERRLLDTMITAAEELNCTVAVLKHDGFVINPHGKDPSAILQSLHAALHDRCPLLRRVKLAIKKIF
jgi:hypothetical protein